MSSGAEAERLAARFLQQQGLILLEQNYRCRYGEIDLVMRDGAALVFVEVRLRTSKGFGGAAASITAAKQAKLIRTAQHYLSSLKQTPPCRFDAVLMQALEGAQPEWLKDAFAA